MKRQQFMAELKQLLGDLPAEERDDALNYYEDYFNEAGPDNEQSLIMQLESPQKVAKTSNPVLLTPMMRTANSVKPVFPDFIQKKRTKSLTQCLMRITGASAKISEIRTATFC